ncbi:MAG: AAA family ATPase, partial [Thermoguttaceae bacterium]
MNDIEGASPTTPSPEASDALQESYKTPTSVDEIAQTSQKERPDAIPEEKVKRFAALYANFSTEIGKVFVGQQELVLGTLVAFFSGGHVLLESVPGLGKTLFASALGRALGCDFGRI